MYDAATKDAAPIIANRPLFTSIWRFVAFVSSSMPPL